MSQQQNNTKNTAFNAARIQAYLDGKLTAPERHELEKAALDDPFLADALEGYTDTRNNYPELNVAEELAAIRNTLSQTAEKTPVIAIHKSYWKIAAAAAVLLVGAVWVYRLMGPGEKKQDELAVTETTNPAKSEPRIGPASSPDTAHFAAPKANTSPENDAAAKQPETPKNRTTTGTQKPAASTAAPAPTAIAAAGKNEPNENRPAAGLLITADSLAAYPDDVGNANLTALNQHIIQGKVIGPDLKPLPNATILLNNTNNGYLSDPNGNFRISSGDTQVAVKVSVAGYQQQEFTLNANVQQNQLMLVPEQLQLNEVVVVAEAAQNRKKENLKNKYKAPEVLIQDAEPVIGWVEFDKYLESKKPELRKAGKNSGELVLSFQVNAKGALSGFRVEQSLSKAQDQAAIQLLKTGPAWHLLKGKKTRAIVIIRL